MIRTHMKTMHRMTWAGTTACLLLLSLGCIPKMTVEQIREFQPERPVELDRLNMFLGEWETTGTIELAMLDKPFATSGRNQAEWTLDGRVLEDHSDLSMGPFGRMKGKTLWAWDAALGKYRMWWFDTLGETSEVVATFNERTNTWRMKARGQKYGRHTSGRGTIRRIDENTLEWTWNEASASGLIRFAKMRGTSRRVAPPNGS
jgi:hypothetical protein